MKGRRSVKDSTNERRFTDNFDKHTINKNKFREHKFDERRGVFNKCNNATSSGRDPIFTYTCEIFFDKRWQHCANKPVIKPCLTDRINNISSLYFSCIIQAKCKNYVRCLHNSYILLTFFF